MAQDSQRRYTQTLGVTSRGEKLAWLQRLLADRTLCLKLNTTLQRSPAQVFLFLDAVSEIG